MKQNLYSENFGEEGKPVFVCLHGLLGSSRNWRSVGKSLAENFLVFSIDLRNHGESFHSEDASIEAMSNDLLQWMDDHNHQSIILCGHSLGGKVAMRLACNFPERIEGLVVADIAPRDYPPELHVPTLDAMLGVDLSSYSTRKEIDLILTEKIPNWAFRQFLLTNLSVGQNGLKWKPNLRVLREKVEDLSINPLIEQDRFFGATLFIRGGKSGYLRNEHIARINHFFPQARVETLCDAGHNVQADDPHGFLLAVGKFLTLK